MLGLVSYPLVKSNSGKLVRQLNGGYTQYIINDSGQLQPREGKVCNIKDERFSENNCTIPMIVDSVGSEKFIAVNGLIPGPTLVVTYNQTVVIEVTNKLINKEVSIHWHGQFQNNTPWMDGVDHITQCPIPTYASFRYIFKANPSGTMWYHSHVGTQRTEGLFGALIVRETIEEMDMAQNELQKMIGEEFTIVDDPEHTLSFLDWQNEDAIEISLQAIGRNPLPDQCDDINSPENLLLPPLDRIGIDGTIVSRISFHAGLINGLGKQTDVAGYNNSRLSIFNMSYYQESSPKFYRFRLIGAQRHEMFNFSISEHKLIVIATDGYLTEPLEVDYIFIHAGERYDFLLKPKTREEANGRTNYLIVAETLDRIESNRALAFLHYGSKDDSPKSPEYEGIIDGTVPRNCSDSSICKALNCPFELILSTFMQCLPVTDLKLLFPTPEEDIPSNDQATLRGNEHFFDFSFTGSGNSAAINGRNFAFPGSSLQTQSNNPLQSHLNCDFGYINCSANRSQCNCINLINIDKSWDTIQFVLTNIGGGSEKEAHPIHLHGHSFQVAGIYYGEYNASGILIGNNRNITCTAGKRGPDPLCTDPHWANTPVDGSVSRKTIRKDTIVVPAGGYVIIRFISNNWGFWYMHCHIEHHFLEGMAAVINEAYDLQNQPPFKLSLLQCGDFTWTVDEFNMKLSNPRERREGPEPQHCPGS